MKKMMLSAVLGVCALATLASGAPRESVTLTGVNSIDELDQAGNEVRSHDFAGAYTARGLRFEGSLQEVNLDTWAADSRVVVGPPGGVPTLVVQFFDTQDFTDSVSIAPGFRVDLVTGTTAAGTWQFRFFEDFWDDDPVFGGTGGPDAAWNTITITLDDEVTPPPPLPTGNEVVTFTGLVSEGPNGAGGVFGVAEGLGTHVFTGGYTATAVGMSGRLLGSEFNEDVRFRITSPGGRSFILQPIVDGVDAPARDVNPISVRVPFPEPAAGTWAFQAFETINDAGIDGTWSTVSFALASAPPPTPPTAEDLGTISQTHAGELVSGAALGAGEVRWYRFTTTGDALAGGSFLDITTLGSSLSPNQFGPDDTMFAVYTLNGAVYATDDDDSAGFLSQLSFGATAPTRPADGTGILFSGQDGELPAGTYYLAVGAFRLDAGAEFNAVSTGTTTGTINLTFRTDLAGEPECVADFDDGSGTGTRDGGVTIDDLVYYLGLFGQGDINADIDNGTFTGTRDQGVTIDDLIYYLIRFAAGC
jgi:hypothetical protein